MADDPISDIVGRWRDRRDGGEVVDPEEVIREHPDVADALRARFQAIEALERHLGAGRPETIGGYRVLREIGRGGMGVVYEAEQVAMRRRVALKVLYPSVTSAPKAVKRFQQEAWAAGRLKHTNIVAMHELGQDRGVWYSAMELVEGRPLSEVLSELRQARGRPRESRLARHAAGAGTKSSFTGTETGTRAYYVRIAEMFAAVAEALQVAHDHGVIHRDVKPGNLLLDAEGALKLVDFGLARLEDSAAAMTVTGDIVGTPFYMSPEQISGGRGGLDHRTDVYSLGATLYEALALRPPFRGETLQAVTARILRDDPAPLRRWDRAIPRDLETIVAKALEKEPARRYRTAAEMARDLRQFAQGGAIRARRTGLLVRGWRKVRRHKLPSALLAAVVVLGVAAGWVAVDRGREAEIRRRLQYDALCREADGAGMAEWGLPEEHFWGAEPGRSNALYTEAIALDPGRADAYLGRALVRLGHSPEARRSDIAAARDRGLPQRTAHLAQAFLFAQRGAWEEATREEGLAAELPRAGAMDACLEGWILEWRGQWQAAEPLLSEAIRLTSPGDTAHFLALLRRAGARERLGDLEGALEDWLVARRLTSDESLETRIKVASLWHRLGKPARGEELFAQTLAEVGRKGTEELWVALWIGCANAREPAWGERVTAAGLDAYPDSRPLAHGRLGFLADLSRPDEVLRLADRILERDPEDPTALNHKGNVIRSRNLVREALACYEGALRRNPRDPGVLTNKGVALYVLGRHAESLEACDAAIAVAPGFASAHAQKATTLTRLGRPQEALKVADDAIRIAPWLCWAHKSRAGALYALERFDEALETATRALEIDPRYPDALHEKARALRKLGRCEEALAAFDRELDVRPMAWTAWAAKAGLLQDLLRWDDAAVAHRKVLDLAPPGQGKSSELARANAHYVLQQYAEALRLYEEVIRLDRDEPEAYLGKGNILKSRGQAEEALAAYRRAVEIDPANVNYECNMGAALMDLAAQDADPDRKGKLRREALAVFDRVLDRDPRNWAALYNRASTLRVIGELEEALAAYDRYLAVVATCPDGLREKAWVLAKLGKRPEALDVCDHLVRLHPRNERAYAQRGDLRLAVKHYEQAVADYKCALELRSGRPPDMFVWFVRMNRGLALNHLGREEEAITDMHAVVEGAPGLWQAWANLGHLQQQMGRHGEAFHSLQQSLKIQPQPVMRAAVAWFHADCPDKRWRDPERAVEMAKQLVAEAPEDAQMRRTLGGCLCRAGRWEEGLAEYRKTMEIESGGEANDWFWVAMASWHLGKKDEASDWYDKAVRSMDETAPLDPGLKRLRAEAAGTLGRGN